MRRKGPNGRMVEREKDYICHERKKKLNGVVKI